MRASDARSIVLERGWLSYQPAVFQKRLLESAHLSRFAAGSNLYHIGDKPGGLYGLASGGFMAYIESR